MFKRTGQTEAKAKRLTEAQEKVNRRGALLSGCSAAQQRLDCEIDTFSEAATNLLSLLDVRANYKHIKKQMSIQRSQ